MECLLEVSERMKLHVINTNFLMKDSSWTTNVYKIYHLESSESNKHEYYSRQQDHSVG